MEQLHAMPFSISPSTSKATVPQWQLPWYLTRVLLVRDRANLRAASPFDEQQGRREFDREVETTLREETLEFDRCRRDPMRRRRAPLQEVRCSYSR